jgi:phosphodiesterase/alkaline phosphatase D-like protein
MTGGRGYGPPAPISVEWAWSGNLSASAATVKARSSSPMVTMRYGTDPFLGSYLTAAGTEGADNVFTFDLSGLSADTEYHYGFTGSVVRGKFRTFPTVGAQASFTVVAASCAGFSGSQYQFGLVSNTPAFDRIADRDPLLFIYLGDRGYPDIASANVTAFRTNYANNMNMARQRNMHLAVPVAYIWSDDDFGTDNADTNAPAKPAAQQVYREHVPHWPLPVSDSIQQTFVIGRVRFILLDNRSYRTPNSATDNSSKTRLGATQKAWLKSELLAATEPLIVVTIESPWIGTDFVTWGIFSTERAELANFFEDNGLTDRILLVGGDHHYVAGDDGTHTQFASGAVTPGPLHVVFAPLDGMDTLSRNTGTWTAGPYAPRRQQYGTIAFDDDGTDITVTATAWSVTDAVEQSQFTLVKVYS